MCSVLHSIPAAPVHDPAGCYQLICNPPETHQRHPPPHPPAELPGIGVVCGGPARTISLCTPVYGMCVCVCVCAHHSSLPPPPCSSSMGSRRCHCAAVGRHSNQPTFWVITMLSLTSAATSINTLGANRAAPPPPIHRELERRGERNSRATTFQLQFHVFSPRQPA